MNRRFDEAELARLWNLALEAEQSGQGLNLEERELLAQFRAMAQSLAFPMSGAPAEWVDRAKGLFPQPARKTFFGALLPRPASATMARGLSNQLEFRAEDLTLRVSLESHPEGLELIGRSSKPNLLVEWGSEEATADEHGEFVLRASGDSPAQLVLVDGETEYVFLLDQGNDA